VLPFGYMRLTPDAPQAAPVRPAGDGCDKLRLSQAHRFS
jgi:hypothetical protein